MSELGLNFTQNQSQLNGVLNSAIDLNTFTMQANLLTHITGDILKPILTIQGFVKLKISLNDIKHTGRYLRKSYKSEYI